MLLCPSGLTWIRPPQSRLRDTDDIPAIHRRYGDHYPLTDTTPSVTNPHARIF